MGRTILHCDMDAFYAAIEQRDHPEWRGKPVIVGGIGKRSVVSTASYEARKFGVHSAMPGSRAHQLCPQGIYVQPRMGAYVDESHKIMGVFHAFTPLVEPLSLDEAFLDVTASAALFGDGAAIARKIQDDVWEATQLTVSIGVAETKYVAKVASDLRKPKGITVVLGGTEVEFLAPLPVARLWGAGKVTQAKLEKLGLKKIGDVQKLTLEDMTAICGEAMGEHFYRLCRGLDPREVVRDRDARSIGHEHTFGDDLTDDAECHGILLGLAEGVGRRLRRAGVRGSTVKLKLRFPPFTTLSRQTKLSARTHDDLEIYRAAKELFDAARPSGAPVRLLGISMADLAEGPADTQGSLFDDPRDRAKKESLLRAVDSIREKFGKDAIRRGR